VAPLARGQVHGSGGAAIQEAALLLADEGLEFLVDGEEHRARREGIVPAVLTRTGSFGSLGRNAPGHAL
jgi:hypothetical protein